MKFDMFELTLFLNIIIGAVIVTLISIILCGCTISFTNISTHGTAQDVVDEEQSADPQIDADIDLPGVL